MNKISTVAEDETARNYKNVELVNNGNGEYTLYNTKYATDVLKFNGSIEEQFVNGLLIIIERTKVVGVNRESISIYDTVEDKVLADHWVIEHKHINAHILMDPKTKKYHIFDPQKYRDEKKNEFDTEFDNSEVLGSFKKDFIYVLEKDGLKEAYTERRGRLLDEMQDDFRILGNVIIYSKDGKEEFCAIPEEDWWILGRSKEHEKITMDTRNPKEKLIYYGRDGNKITAYCVLGGSVYKLFEEKNCFEIDEMYHEQPKTEDYRLQFTFRIHSTNDKWGLKSVYSTFWNHTSTSKTILNNEWSAIRQNPNDPKVLIYENWPRMGLIKNTLDSVKKTECAFDKSSKLSKRYYLLDYNEVCSIYDLEKNKIVYADFTIEEKVNDNEYIVKKDGKEAIIFIQKTINSTDLVVLDGYSHVQKADLGYYYVTKDFKSGIVKDGKEIIKPKYKEIEVEDFDRDEDKDPDDRIIFFKATNMDGSHELYKHNRKMGLKEVVMREYYSYKFWEGLLICYDHDNAHIYSFDGGQLFGLIPSNAKMSVAKYDNNGRAIVFNFNGQLVGYKNGRFTIIPPESIYSAIYELDYGYVVVNEYDKNLFLKRTAEIEKLGGYAVNMVLHSMYDENKEIQEKYPNLVRK